MAENEKRRVHVQVNLTQETVLNMRLLALRFDTTRTQVLDDAVGVRMELEKLIDTGNTLFSRDPQGNEQELNLGLKFSPKMSSNDQPTG